MKRMMWSALAVCLALMVIGCQEAPPPAPVPKVDVQAEAAKIKELDAAWQKDYQARDAAKHASYFAADGSWYVQDYPAATGPAEIQKTAEALFKTETGASWVTPTVVVSESGDLAYTVSRWESTLKDAKGKVTKVVGKSVTVWKKQADGSWKVQVDSGSADAAPVNAK